MTPDEKNIVTENSEFNIPKWLNESYFHDILDKDFKTYKIKEFLAKAALQAGENYMSRMFRVNIIIELEDGRNENLAYVVKSVPEQESGDFVEEMNLFPKEIEMYSRIIPKLEKMFEEVGEKVKFSPKVLKVTNNPDTIVMEDLKNLNFVNMDRHEGLDIKHVEAVLEKLAKFHAASVCLYEKENFIDEQFHEGVFSKKTYDSLVINEKNFTKIYQECMRKWPSGSKYLDKISRLQTNYFQRLLKVLEIDWDTFNVLNHGDLWSNNIMFQHGEYGNVLETYFVDLQMSKWGSPVEDLQYFLISSCNYDIKIKHFDNFICFYYNQLVNNLKTLKYSKSVPKLEDLESKLSSCGFFGVATSVGILSAVKLGHDSGASIDNFFNATEEGNNFKRRVYLNPIYIRELEALLPFFDNRGFLDCE